MFVDFLLMLEVMMVVLLSVSLDMVVFVLLEVSLVVVIGDWGITEIFTAAEVQT